MTRRDKHREADAPRDTASPRKAGASRSRTATQRKTGTSQRTAARAANTAARKGAEPSTAPITKLQRLIDLLSRPEGATLAEMCTATGWRVHSVRGAMAGSLKKKGHVITSEKVEEVRRYRIGAVS